MAGAERMGSEREGAGGWEEIEWGLVAAVRTQAFPLSKVRAMGGYGGQGKAGVMSDFGFDRILLVAAGAEAGRTGRKPLQSSRQEVMGAGPRGHSGAGRSWLGSTFRRSSRQRGGGVQAESRMPRFGPGTGRQKCHFPGRERRRKGWDRSAGRAGGERRLGKEGPRGPSHWAYLSHGEQVQMTASVAGSEDTWLPAVGGSQQAREAGRWYHLSFGVPGKEGGPEAAPERRPEEPADTVDRGGPDSRPGRWGWQPERRVGLGSRDSGGPASPIPHAAAASPPPAPCSLPGAPSLPPSPPAGSVRSGPLSRAAAPPPRVAPPEQTQLSAGARVPPPPPKSSGRGAEA